MVARLPHSDRSYGVDGGVLDPAVSDSGSRRDRGLSGQLPTRETRARAQERCAGLPVAAVPAFGGTVARLVSARSCHLPNPFLASSPRGVGGNGRPHVQHMQKALSQMNLQLHHVLSDLTGQSGMAILDAIAEWRTRPSGAGGTARRAGQSQRRNHGAGPGGRLSPGTSVYAQQSLQAYGYYHQLLAACDQEIETYLRELDSKIDVEQNPLAPDPSPTSRARTSLASTCGVSCTAFWELI